MATAVAHFPARLYLDLDQLKMPHSQTQKDKVKEIVNETTYSEEFKKKTINKLDSWIDQLYDKRIPKSDKDDICAELEISLLGLVAKIPDGKNKERCDRVAKMLLNELLFIDDELNAFDR